MQKILLDTRESSETKEILGLFLKSEEVMLPIGDILVNDSVCFEHKTPSDLITSVFDGRLFTQVDTMKNNYDHSFVLISGSLTEVLEIAEIVDRYSSILAAICSCYVRGCPIIFCNTLVNLSEVVKVLGEKLTDGKVRSRPIEKTRMVDLKLQFVCSLPNVNEVKGKALLKEFGSVQGVMNASEEELQRVYKIGEKTAKGIRAVLEG
jgi:ERCC4-type nuclease